ncbi:RuBisCO accumulation factor 1 [Leptolyngbya sp. FACHB-261]|uniref:RuBisCO accumulation factor 1 n=1 Tax=Leptolyngbya sp. FACHB-261 TaxID=2692806 RepID=UPI001682E207|nr:RuBisCO accumulation factor 1 [Leptolyngbya sp. FACHB-261]MBD2103487.1 hypothetical protein [Leptolyngbya sp. FACHB-261]
MTEASQGSSTPNFQPPAGVEDIDADALLLSLRRKEGSWVEWGQACQSLQKAGYNPQKIFEETGFEPIQQNQIIVAAQVYAGLIKLQAPAAVLDYFERRGSDILYEFRVLTQPERVTAAELACDRKLDVDGAHEVAKAVKDLARLSEVPEGFSRHPGDATAYQFWKAARQKSELQDRARLIARGLMFAHSSSARTKLEQLLTDLTVVKAQPAPRLPLYRVESDEDLPRVLPVVGKLPLSKADLRAVPVLETIEPFELVKTSGTCAWVAVPGWQVVRNAEDPVGLLCDSTQLPAELPGKPEEVLVVVDRSQTTWAVDGYFVVEQEEQLSLQWFDSAPAAPLLGRILLVMRPKKIFDAEVAKDPWQIDE